MNLMNKTLTAEGISDGAREMTGVHVQWKVHASGLRSEWKSNSLMVTFVQIIVKFSTRVKKISLCNAVLELRIHMVDCEGVFT